jgi:D-alanyl-D-alanine carboxypeptidase
MDLVLPRGLPFYPEAAALVVADTGSDGREYLLTPQAAAAWQEMKHSAGKDAVVLELVSAFRGIARQTEIIRTKIAQGLPMAAILTLSAPPGYSEHHTGRAVDINTPGCEATEEPFEHTEAFAWLTANAQRFGFTLSYPRGNAHGFIYEPWHWCFRDGGS